MVAVQRICRRLFKKIYQNYYFHHVIKIKEEELSEQKRQGAQGSILFSIIVPAYNTPIPFFRDMVDSCVNQTYENWELCIADGSDGFNREVEAEARMMMERDARIKYRRLERNGGISENTNEALKMAGGDYLVLLDHDDLLHPAALYENEKMIRASSADFLFSDELVFRDRIPNIVALHLKPDFSFDSLRGNNYICHLCVFSAELLKKAGMLHKEYDGSQDHDLIFRLCEKAGRVVRIPKVLYYWRAHEDSSANDTGKKAYAAVAGRKAVQRHLDRVGLAGEARSVETAPTFYLVDYPCERKSGIGIYVLYEEDEDLQGFIQSVAGHTTYKDYEITPCRGEEERNLAVRESRADYLVFCDSRIRIQTGDWLEKMLMYGQRKDIDLVAPMIVDQSGRVRDTGGDLEAGRPDYGRLFRCFDVEGDRDGAGKETVVLYDDRESSRSPGYMGRMLYAHNVGVVSGMCVMVERERYLGGEAACQGKGKDRYCWMWGKGGSSLWTPQCVLRYQGRF